MRWRASSLLVLVALLGAGCGTPPKSRCERTCTRMVQCARELKLEQGFDGSECVEECRKLERESSTQRFVAEHAGCVDKAEACRQVMECP